MADSGATKITTKVRTRPFLQQLLTYTYFASLISVSSRGAGSTLKFSGSRRNGIRPPTYHWRKTSRSRIIPSAAQSPGAAFRYEKALPEVGTGALGKVGAAFS